ncbi:MAG: aldo/keto reductase [Armatimonadetes bacterium]|nr:aldo/keto reductase [Armatimonadota bacterium]
MLPLRPFGNTGLQVTALAVGLAPLGSMPETFGYEVSVDQALATMHAIFRSPINFLDTAASYSDGESERRIGLALREYGGVPSGYVLATKVDRDLQTGDYSGDQVRRSLERSLRLLGLERLQLVYLHDPEHTTFENVMGEGGPLAVLRQFQEEGIIEHIGVAGGPIDLMIRYVETGAFAAVITHNRYTLLNRSAEPLLQVAHRRGVAVVNAASFGGGILARGPREFPHYAYLPASSDLLDRATRMEAICRRAGVPLAAAALQFSVRDPRIVSSIVGVSKPERVRQLVDLADHRIPEHVWAELEAVGPVEGDPEAGRWG